MSDQATLRKALRELLPHRGRMLLSLASVIVRSALFMLPPFLTRQIIDTALAQRDALALWMYSVASVLTTTLAVFLILADLWASSVVQQVTADLRTRLYRSLQGRPLPFFSQHRTGDLLSRLLKDSQSFSDLFFGLYGGGVFSTGGWAVTINIVGLAAMVWLDPLLTLLCLGAYGLQILAIRYLGRAAGQLSRAAAQARADLTETIRETVSGAAYLKASGLEAHAVRLCTAQLERYEGLQIRTMVLNRLVRIAEWGPGIFCTGAVYLLGGWRIWQGALTPGGLVAFAVYLLWLQDSISTLISLYVQEFKRHLPGVARTFALLEGDAEVRRGGERPAACAGEIRFEDVTFGYEPGRPVLDSFSLRIAPGEVVAVVGRSGQGKSTLADLLLGLQEPQGGRILLDGRDLRSLEPTWLRRQVCAIAQDVTVLNDTVDANVRYGRPEASPDEVRAACDDAWVTEFVRQLPRGLETPVGERGMQVSGGQRQRLEIARSLVYDPAVLILDEATSALDGETEARVMENLRARFAGRTIIIIAHRLSTVAGANRILVLQDGRVVEQGTHQELLSSGGIYGSLYAREA
ncbi:MAG TPA: ABC transporter ATP-binding protein [Symbiobacteriaceae bacterium]|nr:ABC transporter ATP-binding protein [Symbiobacteriaceae bacterium]